MKYSITQSEDQNIIVANATGEWEAEIDNQMVRELMQTVVQTGIRKILLDMRDLQFDFSVLRIFERAQEMRDQRRTVEKASSKVALVYSPVSPKLEEDMRFFENASQNRGLPYHSFRDVEEAIKWLLDS
ncbi:MAG: hypothetical protein U0Z26_05345 [Anaerolineales bacterium]